jgi:hypothetical protein
LRYSCRVHLKRAALSCIAALAVASAAAASAGPSPSGLVLRESDIPPVYAIDPASGTRSNAQEAEDTQIPRATVERWGRIDGYRVWFARPPAVKNRRTGLSAITSSASVFRTAAGAHAGYAALASLCRKDRYRVVHKPGIGDEAVVCTRTVAATGAPATTVYALIWRRGRVMASTGTASLRDARQADETVALALKQDGRIRSVLPS